MTQDRSRRRHIAPVAAVLAIALMTGLVAESPSLYRAFCSLTGYEGTPRRVDTATLLKGKREMHVRFDSNVGGALPWTFEPEDAAMDLRTGKTATVFYKVTNKSDRTITARAVYNIGPPSMGAYFDKISCFCFSDQTLRPHETVEMPVVFFLDPALEKDETMNGVDEVVLSYTFYQQKQAVADNKDGSAKPKL